MKIGLDDGALLYSKKSLNQKKENININSLVDDLLLKSSQKYRSTSFSTPVFTKKIIRKQYASHLKIIFTFIISVFISIVPIVSLTIPSLPVDSHQLEISVSLSPENVYVNDSMLIQIRLPLHLNISSITADMIGITRIEVSYVVNDSYYEVWQANWLIPDIDKGSYIASLSFKNGTDTCFYVNKTWNVISYDSMEKEILQNENTNETFHQKNKTLFSNQINNNSSYEPSDILYKNQTDTLQLEDIIFENLSLRENISLDVSTYPTEEEWSITETLFDESHKRIVISSDIHHSNFTASTTINNRPKELVHLYQIVNGSRTEIDFSWLDSDNNRLVDRIEWDVPRLSMQTYDVIIEITKAEHLDSNRGYISDIYSEVKQRDDVWSEPIPNEEYIRVTFEKPLENGNDITIVARSLGVSCIEVYEKDSESLLASFQDITTENQYKIIISNLTRQQTTFDLKTIGDIVEYDYIVDPTGWISPTGYADPSNQWSYETRAYDGNTATYATHTGAIGWRGFIEFTLTTPIYCDRVRVFSDFGYGVVDLVDIDIYNSTSWVDKFNGTISDASWTEISFPAETNVTKARFRYHFTAGGWVFWLYEFAFWQGQPLTLPAGTTMNATSIDETTAVLRGNITDDGGEPCEYRFQYGSDTNYGSNTTWGGSRVSGSEFGTMIHNLTLSQTYQYRVQIRNNLGIVNCSNKNFTTTVPNLGWITPTRYYDPTSKWENEPDSHDDELDSFARSYHTVNDPNGQWSAFLYLNHSVLVCDKVRFYAKGPTGDSAQIDQVDLDVLKGGIWVDVYQGTFSDKQWVEKSFVQGSVTAARIRFRVSTNNAGLYYELYEFDFNKSRPVPMISNEGPINGSWGVPLQPRMNITVTNPDGVDMTIYWYSNSSGSWQLFGLNSSVGNGTYHQVNNNFSSNNTKYWWKVFVTDGTDSNTSIYYFSTPDTITPSSNVVLITPYWKKTSPVTITATATDSGWSGLKNVTLFYRFSGNNVSWAGWKRVSVDSTSPWSWNFAFSNGTGFYQFYSIACDYAANTETPPITADTWCGYDNGAPISSVSMLLPYWKNYELTINGTATDAISGVKNVTLYYRYSSNNITWGSWINAGLDSIQPWSWGFDFFNGTGYYQFYSIAKDYATNTESAPGVPDAVCGYDAIIPNSSIDAISPYWKNTDCTIYATSDTVGPSGQKNVTLFYYYSVENVTWSGPWRFSTDEDPWIVCSWHFTFPNQTGYYRFYSCAVDNSSNIESPPLANDSRCGFDDQPPLCTITYNRSSSYFKSNDSLRVFATFTEVLSGVNESHVFMNISTMGDGHLSNVTMNQINNTLWFYDWMIPAGSDEDGPFTVRIYATDKASNDLSPYPTIDMTKYIDNTAPVVSVLSVSNITHDSVIIGWITDENTTNNIEYGITTSYGLWFNDSGFSLSHKCLLTNLLSSTTYHYRVLSYDRASNYHISSDQIFTTSSTSTVKKKPQIIQFIQNRPPTNPIIEGPTQGFINIEYNFTVCSADADIDFIKYTFDWGDGGLESSGFLPSNVNCVKQHRWSRAGKYFITVSASDNYTTSLSKKTIWIDALSVGDIGYLLDTNSDGIFDIFHNDATGTETLVDLKDEGIYLIDSDDDGRWDYEYYVSLGILSMILHQQDSPESKPLPYLLIGLVSCIVVLFVILFFHRRSLKK